MSAPYKLQRRARECMGCERPFDPDATIVSAIYESGEAFVRRDLCEECFENAAGSYSHWRTRQPPPPEPRHTIDFDLALSFLERLIAEADPRRAGLVYVLTLLLSRKRRISIRQTQRLPEGELLTIVFPGPEDDITAQVRGPRLTAEDVTGLQAALSRLLGIEVPEPEGESGSGSEGGTGGSEPPSTKVDPDGSESM